MQDEYFGVKELYEVVLRAKVPMQFGKRYIEEQEPVLYFENISMAVLNQTTRPILARGGWANVPRVVWEDRDAVEFSLSEGVMSSTSMSILLSSEVAARAENEPLYIHKKEGPVLLKNGNLYPEFWPVGNDKRKTFIFEYARDAVQKKVYGTRIRGEKDPFDENIERPCIKVYKDKQLQELADTSKQYIIDYYYEYKDEALIYTIQKERFNGLFTLEGKFYSKDENDGINYTNLIYMPKVRVVSDINLRLGERADPTMSVFNIIGMPEHMGGNKNSVILEITRLDRDIDSDDI